MVMLAVGARTQSGGHPLWHLLIVAGGAVGVYVAIVAKEHWHRRQLAVSTGPLLALAALSAAAGMIHAGLTTDHFHEAVIYGVFFVAASTFQTVWSVLILYRPNRTLLSFAAAANAGIIILWILTRTAGLPLGPQRWHPEPIGVVDVTCTLLELALVLGAAYLLARNAPLHGPDVVGQRLQVLRAHHPTLVRSDVGPPVLRSGRQRW